MPTMLEPRYGLTPCAGSGSDARHCAARMVLVSQHPPNCRPRNVWTTSRQFANLSSICPICGSHMQAKSMIDRSTPDPHIPTCTEMYTHSLQPHTGQGLAPIIKLQRQHPTSNPSAPCSRLPVQRSRSPDPKIHHLALVPSAPRQMSTRTANNTNAAANLQLPNHTHPSTMHALCRTAKQMSKFSISIQNSPHAPSPPKPLPRRLPPLSHRHFPTPMHQYPIPYPPPKSHTAPRPVRPSNKMQ